MRRPFSQVDVFTSVPYMGNPVAVVSGADGLTDDEMQRVTAWMNLSETTFLLEPTSADSDYRVRIFTPDRELPFAGHPTLGTCRVWLDQGGVPRRPGLIIQECGAGLVTIRSSGERLAFAAPPLVRSGPVSDEDLAAACAFLGIDADTAAKSVIDADWVANGPPWMGLLLRSADDVLSICPEGSNPHDLFVGVVGPYPPGGSSGSGGSSDNPTDHPADFEVRAFFPVRGALAEDPVTGSLNASLGQWLTAAGHATAPYTASQGAALGRDGRIYIERDDDGTVWVGGDTVTCTRGTIEI